MLTILTCLCDADESLVRLALHSADNILTSILDRNSNYEVDTVDVGALYAWFADDCPSTASEIEQRGLVEILAARFGRYLALWGHARGCLETMHQAARDELACRHIDSPAREHIAAALRHCFPRWPDAARLDAMDDWIQLLSLWLHRTVASHGEGIEQDVSVSRYRTEDSSAMLDLVRLEGRKSPDTAFLISPQELPETIAGKVTEDVCVAVRLTTEFDASWAFHAKASEINFQPLAFDDSPTGNELKLMLALNNGLILFEFEMLSKSVFRNFRAELPIVYVSPSSAILTTYPFNQFAMEARFFTEQTEFFESFHDSSFGSFERRIRDLNRNRLPRHVYVKTEVRSLSARDAAPSLHVDIPRFQHWTRYSGRIATTTKT